MADAMIKAGHSIRVCLLSNGNFHIPPDLVVKSQAADIVEVIVSRNQAAKRQPKVVEQQKRTGRAALHLGGSLVYHVTPHSLYKKS